MGTFLTSLGNFYPRLYISGPVPHHQGVHAHKVLDSLALALCAIIHIQELPPTVLPEDMGLRMPLHL